MRRTDCGRFNHVSDGESLYCLIFGRTSRAVGASDRLDMASPFLITSATFLTFSTLLLGWRFEFAMRFPYLDARFLTMAGTKIGG